MTTKPAPSPESTGPERIGGTHYHGDLRKGAYLRRRADYQMQAQSTMASGTQAGETSATMSPQAGTPTTTR